MNKSEARSQLNWSYFYILLGLISSFFYPFSVSNDTLGWIYIVWSAYWGYRIINTPFNDFFYKNTPIHINAKNADDYIDKTILFKESMFFKKVLWGFFLGMFGGAIYRQIRLSIIAYF